MRRLLKWSGLLLFWVALTYAALEFGLRLTGPSLGGQIGTVARYVTTGQPYSETWQPAWRENRDHYYALRPDVTDALQYGSPTVSFRLTTHKLWDDSLPPDEGIGFRTRPIDYRVDAVVVGDSFAFCFTEETDCWVTRLAAATGLGIANLGQPVTGSLSHARILADYAAPLEPPLVIWQFFGNDFNDDYGLLAWRGDIEPLDDPDVEAASADAGAGQWLARNSVVWALGEVLLTGQWSGTPDSERVFTPNYTAAVNDRGDVLQFGKRYEQSALDMTRAANQFGLEQSRAALREAQARVDSWGGELIVVLIPTREEVYEHITEPLMGSEALGRQRSARAAMLDLCASLTLTCLDPIETFKAEAVAGEMLYYSDDMHLNARGNALLAEFLAPALPNQINEES
jgi:lysophospholipase L1-like esterase